MSKNANNLDISQFLEDEINKETRKTAIKLVTGLVLATAVDKGVLKGGWLASVEAPNYAEPKTEDKTGQSTISKSVNIIGTAQVTKYPTIYIQNRYPYSYRIMETGYSDQTPPRELTRQIMRATNG